MEKENASARDCKECYFVELVNGEYVSDCEIYGTCPCETTEDEELYHKQLEKEERC